MRSRTNSRRGMSLLEVTIGSVMVASITMMAASVTFDLTRGMADNIARTRLATEARLAIESFRRDFGGNDPDAQTGERNQWRLVGRMIPTADELRLCFDDDMDNTADWASPDRVVIYSVENGNLIRDDLENERTNEIAHHVDAVNFEVIGQEIRITIDFDLGNVTESYVFNTPDI